MQNINKEWITPEECIRQAEDFERAAKKFEQPDVIADLLGRAKARRATAARLRADAADLREEAEHQTISRASDHKYLADHAVAA